MVTFNITADRAGKKYIDVNGLIGSLTVRGELPPPAQIPLPLETTEPTPPKTTGFIIGGGTLLAALLAAMVLYFIWWRRRSAGKQETP